MMMGSDGLFVSVLFKGIFALGVLRTSSTGIPFERFPPPGDFTGKLSYLVKLVRFSFPPGGRMASVAALSVLQTAVLGPFGAKSTGFLSGTNGVKSFQSAVLLLYAGYVWAF